MNSVSFAGPKVVVIAEAGVNHNGDLGRAFEMVDAAAEAGADYVKFQAFSAEGLVAAGARTASYQARNAGENSQLALLKPLEMGLDAFAALAERCRARAIGFLCTAFDVDAITDLVACGMNCVKVASGELTNSPALRRLAALKLPILLSTGMATLAEVEHAVEVIEEDGPREIVLLQCTSLYPAPFEALNLRAISTLARIFLRPVGFSDHSLGDHAAVAAVALGATVIEKHFTLDRTSPGPDHVASLEPAELAAMITRIHETSRALGDGVKRPTAAELDIARLVRRSWHATTSLPAGHRLGAADVALKRPAAGLSPDAQVVGRVLAKAVEPDQPLAGHDLV